VEVEKQSVGQGLDLVQLLEQGPELVLVRELVLMSQFVWGVQVKVSARGYLSFHLLMG
jgi:hypothetical protein